MMRIGRHPVIKVDVKIVSDHPYPWHSGSPETASGGSTKPKNSNRSGGAHKSRKSDASKQNKKRWY
jgi:ATP-dependent RNA helicase RhlE